MAKLSERELTELGKKQEALALQLASKESDIVSKAVKEQMEAKEITESGAIRILLALQQAYGQEMAAFPRPGSTAETSDNPDKFKVSVQSSNGSQRLVDRSFFVEFADNTKEGKAILQELKYCKALTNMEMDKSQVPETFKEKYPNPEAIAVRKSYLEGRRNTIRTAYKKAVALGYQCEDIDSLDKVSITFVWANKEKTEVQNTKTPIRLSDVDNPDKWGYFSISQVMRMSVPKALESGGTYQALLDTVRRDGKEGQGGKSEAAPKQIRTADTFAARIVDIHEALDFAFTDKNGRQFHKDIKDSLHKAGSDDVLLSLYDLKNAFEELLKDDKLTVRLEKLLQNREKEAA